MLGNFFFFHICFITSEGYYSNVSVVPDLYSAYFFFFHIYYIFFFFHIHVLLILVLTFFILSIVGNVLFHPHLLKCSPAINEILLSCTFSRMSKKKQQIMHRGMLVCTPCCFLCHIMTLSMFYYLHTSLLSIQKLPLFSFCFGSKKFLENDSFFGKYFVQN